MLSAKARRFVAEYLVDLNATQAAIRAGYSPKTARQIGSQNLSKLDIQSAIAAGQAAHFERLALAADEAMRVNAAIVRFDPIALQDDAGNYRTLKQIPAAARRCLRRIRIHKLNLTTGDGQTDTVIDYEFLDKHAALDRDYKRLGLLKERLEISGSLDLEKKIAAVRQRLAAAAQKAKG
jgi:phage terminase small subunit